MIAIGIAEQSVADDHETVFCYSMYVLLRMYKLKYEERMHHSPSQSHHLTCLPAAFTVEVDECTG
jgi:hypothetical protein